MEAQCSTQLKTAAGELKRIAHIARGAEAELSSARRKLRRCCAALSASSSSPAGSLERSSASWPATSPKLECQKCIPVEHTIYILPIRRKSCSDSSVVPFESTSSRTPVPDRAGDHISQEATATHVPATTSAPRLQGRSEPPPSWNAWHGVGTGGSPAAPSASRSSAEGSTSPSSASESRTDARIVISPTPALLFPELDSEKD